MCRTYLSLHVVGPVDGRWGTWSEWSSCSSTCESGVLERTRKCDNPRPSNGGKQCRGLTEEYKSSNVTDDPSE